MGKYALLLTFALVLGTTLLARQGMQTDRDTSASQADRQKEVLARQIARSVFDRGISELRRDYAEGRDLNIDSISGETIEHKGVSFELRESDPDESRTTTAVGVLTGSGNADGSVSVTAKGHYEDAKYRIRADVVRGVDGFSGLGVEGGLSSVNAKGDKFLVSGRDTDPVDQNETPTHGSGGGADQPGMRLNDGTSANNVKDEFPDDQVVGVNGNGDVVNEEHTVDLDALAQEIKDDSTHSRADLDDGSTVGSQSDPAIVAVDGDLKLTGDTHGIGALLVEGNFVMRGDVQWEGLVLVRNGDAEVDTEGDLLGNARIFGSLMQQTSGSGTLEIGGSVRMQYSTKALKVLTDVLPTMGEAATLRVTNRSSKMLGSGV